MMAILRAGQGGSAISVKSSSGLSTVVIEERKKSPAATGRSPPALRTVSRAPSATITAGSSAAGSACARMPPSVPRADPGVADERHGLGNRRAALTDQQRALERVLADQSSDLELVAGTRIHGGQRGKRG